MQALHGYQACFWAVVLSEKGTSFQHSEKDGMTQAARRKGGGKCVCVFVAL